MEFNSGVLELPLDGHHAVDESEPARPPRRVVSITGRDLPTSAVYDTYWRFAAARQRIYEARVAGAHSPWTDDPILSRHRFTNCFRAADRVSQHLIQHVIYEGDQSVDEVVFRILLFKMFNKTSTWELLEAELGSVSLAAFAINDYDQILSDAFAAGRTLYSAAYVVPPPKFGAERKHTNHLRLLAKMCEESIWAQLADAHTMAEAFELLRSYPAMGDFLAYQMLIDINYSEAIDFSEMDFVVAGPGARDGIRKCFGPDSSGIEADVIRYMADVQEEEFKRLGLTFSGLRGRPLQLIDCQNLFCEVDKYARVAHPSVPGLSGRSRIKQKFTATSQPVTATFPPKWGI